MASPLLLDKPLPGTQSEERPLWICYLMKGEGGDVTGNFKYSKEHGLNFFRLPPPWVRRCNGTTAGLGYLEVVWIVLT
jgi:hypothetical protein